MVCDESVLLKYGLTNASLETDLNDDEIKAKETLNEIEQELHDMYINCSYVFTYLDDMDRKVSDPNDLKELYEEIEFVGDDASFYASYTKALLDTRLELLDDPELLEQYKSDLIRRIDTMLEWIDRIKMN